MERWEEGAGKCARVGREEEDTGSNRPGQLGGIVIVLQSAALSEDVFLLCDNEAVCVLLRNGWGKEEK